MQNLCARSAIGVDRQLCFCNTYTANENKGKSTLFHCSCCLEVCNDSCFPPPPLPNGRGLVDFGRWSFYGLLLSDGYLSRKLDALDLCMDGVYSCRPASG